MDETGNHHSQQMKQKQKTKHRMFSLISGRRTMRTHEHREGNITHWDSRGMEGLRKIAGVWGLGEG